MNETNLDITPVVAVSACLLGRPCRFDGASKPCEQAMQLARYCKVVPICPEVAGGFPIPHPPCEIEAGTRPVRVVDATGAARDAAFHCGGVAVFGAAARRGLPRGRAEVEKPLVRQRPGVRRLVYRHAGRRLGRGRSASARCGRRRARRNAGRSAAGAAASRSGGSQCGRARHASVAPFRGSGSWAISGGEGTGVRHAHRNKFPLMHPLPRSFISRNASAHEQLLCMPWCAVCRRRRAACGVYTRSCETTRCRTRRNPMKGTTCW